MPSYAIGVDLGGTNLRIAAVDEHGTLLHKVTLGTEVAKGRDFVIGEMTTAIRQVLDTLKAPGQLEGIGIGVPGIIDMSTGFLFESPNLPGWDNYPVHSDIERRLGTPVILENDANAAAMGEKWLGAGRDVETMLMLTLGTGVGGGIIMDDKIWHGMSGMAGELGHITVYPDGHICGCGNHGCIEQYASATAITRMATEAIAAGEAEGLRNIRDAHPAEFNSRTIYQAAVQGDRGAQEVFYRVGRALGIALAGMINAFNPHMVVLGGGASNAWDAFAPSIYSELHRRCFVYRATAPKQGGSLANPSKTIITRAVLGGDAGLYGAAKLPLQRAQAKR
jgi:glucokinase